MNVYMYLSLFLVAVIPSLFIFLLPKNKSFFERNLIKGIGLGVYTALLFILFQESFENSPTVIAFSGLLLGLVVSLLIGYYFKEFHHHHEAHDENDKHHHVHSKISATKILVSDFFHNIVDGIAIVSGFNINSTVGFTAVLGVLGHQIIQQSGQQALLVQDGIKPQKAIWISFFISFSVFIALIIKNGESIEGILMSISAGIILFKIFADIKETKWGKENSFGFIIGFVTLFLLLIVIPHGH